MRLFIAYWNVNVFGICLLINCLFNYNAPYSPTFVHPAKRILK